MFMKRIDNHKLAAAAVNGDFVRVLLVRDRCGELETFETNTSAVEAFIEILDSLGPQAMPYDHWSSAVDNVEDADFIYYAEVAQ